MEEYIQKDFKDCGHFVRAAFRRNRYHLMTTYRTHIEDETEGPYEVAVVQVYRQPWKKAR